MTFKRLHLVPLLLLALGACGHKGVITAGAEAGPRVYYVSPETFRAGQFPPPPLPDTMRQQADIAAVLAWQNKRTEDDCARARRTAEEEFEAFWGGESPFPGPVPEAFRKFFKRLASDVEEAKDALKDRFARPRPFAEYPEAQPCVKAKKSFSYPSGHASAARVTALVLSDIVPARRDEFFAKADEIARDRVVGGAHYPSDIAAGKAFGDMFHAELLKSEAYRADIEKMKSLLKK